MKRNGRSMSMPAGIVTGIVVSLIFTVIGAAILAWLVTGEKVSENAIGYGIMGILAASAWVGCLVAWKQIQHQRLVVVGICAVGYFAMLLTLGLLFGGVRQGIGATVAAIGLGGAISVIPAFLKNGSGGKKHRYTRFR